MYELIDAQDYEKQQHMLEYVVISHPYGKRGTVDLGTLQLEQLRDMLRLPDEVDLTILERQKPFPLTPDSTWTRTWKDGDACARLIVHINDVDAAWDVVGTRDSRQRVLHEFGLQVRPGLTKVEQVEQKHLQSQAMGIMMTELHMSPGWRRSKLTWRVIDKNNWAVLGMRDVGKTKLTKERMEEIVKRVEDRVVPKPARMGRPMEVDGRGAVGDVAGVSGAQGNDTIS